MNGVRCGRGLKQLKPLTLHQLRQLSRAAKTELGTDHYQHNHHSHSTSPSEVVQTPLKGGDTSFRHEKPTN